MCQLVGLRVELSIRQPLVLVLHRQRFRCALDLLLKQLMNQCILRIHHLRGIESVDELLSLCLRHNLQRQQLPVRRILQRIHHLRHRTAHVTQYTLRLYHSGLRLRRQRKSLSQIIHRNHKRIVRALLRPYHLNARTFPCTLYRLTVPEVEHRTEQRHITAQSTATLHLGKRGLFILQQINQRRLHRMHRAKYISPLQLQAYRQRIDEHPHRTVRPGNSPHAPRQHTAKHHVIPGRTPGQHQTIGHMEQRRRTHAQPSDTCTDTLRQPIIQRTSELLYPRTVSMHVRQPKRRRLPVHIAQHLPEKRYRLRLPLLIQTVGNKLPIRHRLLQCLFVTFQNLHCLRHQHIQRYVVQNHMVKCDQPIAWSLGLLPSRDVHRLQPQQRRPARIHDQ